jgi:outer membrane protein assembly factor BamB
MKNTLVGAVCALLLLLAAAAASDNPTRIWSQPSPPSREALDRLNLEMAWAVYVPMDGKRDGFFSIQADGNQLIVQTRSGMFSLIDAEDGGRALWRSRPGRPYQASLAPAFNSKCVFINDSGDIYGLERETGAVQWKYPLRVTLSAPLSADEYKIYLSNVEARLIALTLPAISTPEGRSASPPKKSDQTGAPPVSTVTVAPTAEETTPVINWDYDTNQRVENKAILSKDAIFMSIFNGTYLGVPKTGDLAFGNVELYRYAGDSRFSAPPGNSDDAAYLGTEDSHLYAVGVDSGKVLWRYIPGKPVTRAPVSVDVSDGAAVDHDLYVTADVKGMARLNRETGEPLWNIRGHDFSPEADRILAVNPKFVYATDGAGKMLVLDRKNGAQLSRYDVSDFVFPVVNNQSDRIYLASNDGLIVCLHDKDFAKPLLYHATTAPASEKALADRIKELKDKLAKPISDPGGPETTFKAWREKIAKEHGVKIFVSTKAFKENVPPVPGPDDRMIQPPKVDNKPLGDVLRDVLTPLDATYTQLEDTIVIGPVKK